MRASGNRATAVVIAALILLVAGVTAGVVVAGRDDPEPSGLYVSWEKRPWIVGAISGDQRILTLSFSAGGCTSGRGRAEFNETQNAARVTKVESREQNNGSCTLDLKGGAAKVRLRRPLAGRLVQGSALHQHTPPVPTSAFTRAEKIYVRVPRVAGLNGAQARRLLRAVGFRVAPIGRAQAAQEVAGTRPPHRTRVPQGPRGRRSVEMVFNR